MSKKIFAVNSGGKTTYLKVNREKVNIPGYGVMSAEELVSRPDAVAFALTRETLKGIFAPAEEKEYKALIAEEEKGAAEVAAKVIAEAKVAEHESYMNAKAIVLSYEAKTGKKPGEKKTEAAKPKSE